MHTLSQTKIQNGISFIKAVALTESVIVKRHSLTTVISWTCMLENGADLCVNQGDRLVPSHSQLFNAHEKSKRA